MCSWCWAFRPAWSALQAQLPQSLQVKYLLGGLAPDSEIPMTTETQTMIRQHWQKIEKKFPELVSIMIFGRTANPDAQPGQHAGL